MSEEAVLSLLGLVGDQLFDFDEVVPFGGHGGEVYLGGWQAVERGVGDGGELDAGEVESVTGR
jgi:hypothetical protein